MRLLHLSDVHLGFRQYQKVTPTGINQREADIAHTFRRAVDRIIELRPDVVLIAGDVFHNVRPTNPAILHAFTQLSRLVQSLPDANVIMVAGNHDTPRSVETGCILRLFTPLGIDVVDETARRIPFPERSLSVLAVPDVPGPRPALTPDHSARYNVLLLHGEVEGMLPDRARQMDRATLAIPLQELAAHRWSYVALGHYHVYRRVAANAYYSGSIDYTSANPWGELVEEHEAGVPGKGMIEYDLATGAHTFHPLPAARTLVDLPPVEAEGMGAPELDAAIRARVDGCAGGIAGKIVRQVVRDVPVHIARELDHKTLRDYQRQALHYQLDPRRPEVKRLSAGGAPGGARRVTLSEMVRDQLMHRVLAGDIDRDALVELGLRYLRDAESDEGQPGGRDGAGGGDAMAAAGAEPEDA